MPLKNIKVELTISTDNPDNPRLRNIRSWNVGLAHAFSGTNLAVAVDVQAAAEPEPSQSQAAAEPEPVQPETQLFEPEETQEE